MTKRRLPSALTLVVTLLCLAAETDAQTKARPGAAPADEKAVRDRVAAYWAARASHDLKAFHPFYEPAFRAKYPPDVFARDFRRLNRFAPEFVGIEGVKMDADRKRAAVKVRLRTRPAILDGQELVTDVEEVWLLEEGQWWRAGEALLPNV